MTPSLFAPEEQALSAVPSIGRTGPVAAPGADATHALYERYSRRIYAYCYHQLSSREEAEDAVQTTFMNAFNGLKRGVAVEAEQAWLYKIAENVCLARRRSSWRRGRIESPNDLELLQEITPSRGGRSAVELIGLEDALAAMPETQRRAILLREWQGLSYREVAAELELSQAAVETLIFRARRALAKGLEEPPPKKRRLGQSVNLGSLLAGFKSLLTGGAAVKAVAVAVAAGTATIAAHETQRVAVHHRHAKHAPASVATSRAHARTTFQTTVAVATTGTATGSTQKPHATSLHTIAGVSRTHGTLLLPPADEATSGGTPTPTPTPIPSPTPTPEPTPTVTPPPAITPAPTVKDKTDKSTGGDKKTDDKNVPAPQPTSDAKTTPPATDAKTKDKGTDKDKSAKDQPAPQPAPDTTTTTPPATDAKDKSKGKDKKDQPVPQPTPTPTPAATTTPPPPVPPPATDAKDNGKDKKDQPAPIATTTPPPPVTPPPAVTPPAPASDKTKGGDNKRDQPAPVVTPPPAPAPPPAAGGNGKGKDKGK